MESRLVRLLIQDMEKLVVKGSIVRRIYMQVFPSIFYVWNQDRNSKVNLYKYLETLIFFH